MSQNWHEAPELAPSTLPELCDPEFAAIQGRWSNPRVAQRKIFGCSILAFSLSTTIALLSIAVIGLAVGTGVQGRRAHDAELKLAALKSAASKSNVAVIDRGCSTSPDAISGTSYTSQFFNNPTFRIYCNSNAPNDPLQSLFTGDFDDCIDACASYSANIPLNFPTISSSSNFTCFGVSFLPEWTNRTNAMAVPAPGNCYLKPGPQNTSALTLPENGGIVHAAILQES
ncbi:hypothetical protein GGR58DRAFT_500157 [Xylaria digitata]|nr:hypothetical protein GGR58DRAFT_500157 [Xylaria digitata]